MTLQENSRVLAKSWPHPRHRHFEQTLRDAATAWFARRQYQPHTHYSYCLAEWKDWPKNIILPEVHEYIAGIRDERVHASKPFPLHKYIHHGLSSQAFLFNLVGPLIVRKDLAPLRAAAEAQGLEWPSTDACAEFEYEDRNTFNEDAGQPTSLDLVIKDHTGTPRICIESKLVEKGFGGCSVFENGDCEGRNPVPALRSCYLHHIGRRYWNLMRKYGFLDGVLSAEASCIFVNHYQFFRELLFAVAKGGVFVLLSDERSPTFAHKGTDGERGLVPFLLQFVPAALKTRVGHISAQALLAEIEKSGRHAWASEFRTKYAM